MGLVTARLRPTPRARRSGTGWSSARSRPVAARAGEKLKELGYRNVRGGAGGGYQGWPQHAPYDAILVTAAPDHIPQPLLDQLALGGRLILPLGKKDSQSLVLIRRTHAGFEHTTLLPVAFVPMTGAAEEKYSPRGSCRRRLRHLLHEHTFVTQARQLC